MTELEEKTLRESIRSAIRFVKQKRLSEEENLRSVIREFAHVELHAIIGETQVADVDQRPTMKKMMILGIPLGLELRETRPAAIWLTSLLKSWRAISSTLMNCLAMTKIRSYFMIISLLT